MTDRLTASSTRGPDDAEHPRAPLPDSTAPRDQESARRLTAYIIAPIAVNIEPADAGRPWFAAEGQQLANRCHPLLVANQAGWFVQAPEDVEVRWTGRNDLGALRIRSRGPLVISNFGHGIVTWRLPYLFRTPPGWHLWVKGPANWPLDGAVPLEGIVETDHAAEPFTMNWKLTRRGTIHWQRGDPICQIVPFQTQDLERWQPAIVEQLPDDVRAPLESWAAQRVRDNESPGPYRARLSYRRAASIRRLSLRPFQRL